MLNLLLALALLATPVTAVAQRHKLAAIDAQTPEGKSLQAINAEADAAKKLTMLETFSQTNGGHPAMGWVLAQMQAAYAKAAAHDKAIAAGEKLLSIDPDDMEAAYGNLKSAEGLKDSEAILKWAGVTADIAKRVPSRPQRKDESEAEHRHALDFGSQVVAYTEYAVYAAALQEKDSARIYKLVETLEQRNPSSQYLTLALGQVANAARAGTDHSVPIAIAERAYSRGQYHEDLLLLMADQSMKAKNDAKVLQYGAKLIEFLSAKGKPEGMSDADWEKKKKGALGLAFWMTGRTLVGGGKHADGDQALRQALPLLNEQLLADAYFNLGIANYKMAQAAKSKLHITDALAFMRKAAAIKGPYQERATKNVAAMSKEFGVR